MLQNAVPKSSGSLAVGTNTTVSAAAVNVTSITLRAGSGASSILLLDGSSGSTLWAIGNAATDSNAVVSHVFPNGLSFPNGLYVTIAGTAATAFIAYQPLG